MSDRPSDEELRRDKEAAGLDTESSDAPVGPPIAEQTPKESVRLTEANLREANRKFDEEQKRLREQTGLPVPPSSTAGSSRFQPETENPEKYLDDRDDISEDDELSVAAEVPPSGAGIHGPAAGEPDNSSQLVLTTGHIIDVVTKNGKKSLIIPNTNNLSSTQIRELARGLAAAAIAEGAYTTNPDGSFHFKIDAKDFRLRAALEAQFDALGHTYNKPDPKLVAQEKQQFNGAFILKSNYYENYITSIKKATVEDNINYCAEADEKRAELKARQQDLANLHDPDPDVKKALEKNISETKKELKAGSKPEYDQNGKLTEASKLQAKKGFYRKYLGGVPGEKEPDQKIAQARIDHLGQKARWMGTDKAYREFKKNFMMYHAEKLFTDPQTDLSNLKPEERMQKIFNQVIEGGIYQKNPAARQKILQAIASNDNAGIAAAALEFGKQRSEIAAKTTPDKTAAPEKTEPTKPPSVGSGPG